MAEIILTVLAASAMILGLTNAAADFQNISLELHNKYRAAHEVEELIMDDNLNVVATQCANYYFNRKKMDHTCPMKRGNMGENLYYVFTTHGHPSNLDVAKKAVASWYDEHKEYDFNNPGFHYGNQRFTQLVWKESKKLGFGLASGNMKAYACALYSPAGNIGSDDDYVRNVLRSKGKGRGRSGEDGESSSSISSMMIQISSYKYCIIYSAAMFYALAILL